MSMTIEHRRNKSTDTTRLPSPAIWSDCPWDDLRMPKANIDGATFFDDFNAVPLPPTLTTQIAYPPWYKAFATSGNTIGPVQSINSVQTKGGFMRFLHNTNNNSCSIATLGQPFFMDGLPATSGKLWFECRLAVNSLLTNMQSWFVGLAETSLFTLATGVPLNAGDPITNDGSIIGFRSGEDALGVIDTVKSDRATSFTNIKASAVTISAAYTFIKLGFRYDPKDLDGTVRFYADNLELATPYTNTDLTGNTNLDANTLGMIFATVSDSVATGEIYLDWWRCAQVYP